MPIRLSNAATCCLALVATCMCTTGGEVSRSASENDMPPVDILEIDFAQAPYVLEIEVKNVRRIATFRSDSGEVGYVQYSVTGTILDILKAHEGHEFFSNEVEYRFTHEFDPSADPSIAKGGRYLVFLMPADDPAVLWLIGEGAQLELSPQLSKTIRQTASHENT